MIKFFVAFVFIMLLLAPAFIAFKRKLKYRWVILIVSLIPSWGFCWVGALIWSVWPGDRTNAKL